MSYFTKRKTLAMLSAAAMFSSLLVSSATATLVNGGFELPLPANSSPTFRLLNEALVPGWETTAADNTIELWDNGFSGVTSFEGVQHAELNAFVFAALFQDAPGIAAGSTVGFEFAHRGRSGVDTMALTITDLGADNTPGGVAGDADTVLFTKQYSTGNTDWAFYTSIGEPTIIALGNNVRFSYEAISAVGGASVGNFLDAADFGVGVNTPPDTDTGNAGAVPEPISATLGLMSLAALGIATKRRAA